MSKTIVICGFGPGISAATAEQFGKNGFGVALVARNRERLEAGVKALAAQGVQASAFEADLAKAHELPKLFGKIREKLGPITVLHWNASSGGAAGDLLTADAASLREVFELPVVSLMIATQTVLPDLKARPDSALLVTNGALGLYDAQADELGVLWNVMGLSVANSAKHKLVRLLAAKLKGEGVYVGEVVVAALVKGTASDTGSATLEASRVADRFWEMYQERREPSTLIS